MFDEFMQNSSKRLHRQRLSSICALGITGKLQTGKREEPGATPR